jgi:hypothetical protein
MFAIAARFTPKGDFAGLEVAQVSAEGDGRRLMRRRTGSFVWNTAEEAAEAMTRINPDDCLCSSDGMRNRTYVGTG